MEGAMKGDLNLWLAENDMRIFLERLAQVWFVGMLPAFFIWPVTSPGSFLHYASGAFVIPFIAAIFLLYIPGAIPLMCILWDWLRGTPRGQRWVDQQDRIRRR
jgi:hypothetical protein